MIGPWPPPGGVLHAGATLPPVSVSETNVVEGGVSSSKRALIATSGPALANVRL
jgi:hypothetical protein